MRDLGRAFTRAIPVASQADPIWSRLPAGDGGKIEVLIRVDDSGRIGGFEPTHRDPPKHLVDLVKRTVAYLEVGTFALRGQVGAGAEVLALSARLTDEAASDDELEFKFDGKRGKASFRQASGRRVDIDVRVVRVDRAP